MAENDLKNLKERHDKDSKRLEELIESRRELREVLRQEFMADITKHFSAEEIEAIEVAQASDVVRLVLDRANEFITTKVDEYDAEIKSFKEVLDENNKNLESMNARDRFIVKHPDVDMDALEDFGSYDILPRKMNELLELPIDERLEEILKLFNAQKGGEDKNPTLPDDMEGVAGATGNIDQGEADSTKDDNFAENFGQNR